MARGEYFPRAKNMEIMNLYIESQVSDMFPNLKIGVIEIIGANNTGENYSELIEKTLHECNTLHSEATIKQNRIFSLWRDAYRKMGLKPKKHQPTAESFIKRVVKSQTVPAINGIVNAYLLTEVLFSVPIGGYDLDRLPSSNIELKLTSGEEEFIDIGQNRSSVSANEIGYFCEDTLLTRHWNYRDCYKSRIDSLSNNVVLMTEFIDAEEDDFIMAILDNIEDNIVKYVSDANFTKKICMTSSLNKSTISETV